MWNNIKHSFYNFFRDGEFPLTPRERERLPPSHPARHMPPPEPRSPPPRMLPPDSRGSPPRMLPPDARSPPPYDRRGLLPPLDSRSPPMRLPPPDMVPPIRGPLPPHMGPPPMGSPGPRMDSPRGEVPAFCQNLLIIMKVFIECKIVSLETVLSAYTHTHTYTDAHKHADYAKLKLYTT